jgi:MFS family permease
MPLDHDPYAALRHADYRRFLAGAVAASIGGEVLAVAVGWEFLQRAKKIILAASTATEVLADASLFESEAVKAAAGLAGLAGLAQFLPVLLLALPAGQMADRYSRKALLLAAVSTMALVGLGLSAIAWFSGPVPLIFVFLVLAGCSRAFSMSSRNALLFQIVPVGDLGNAVTWNSSGWQIASVGGPALGGGLIALVELTTGSMTAAFTVTYAFAGLCCLSCVVLLIPIQPRAVERSAETRSLASLLAGVRFVWQTELLLAAITLDLFAVLLGGATALLPIFADQILGINAVGLGCLRAAPAVGALVMAMILAHRPPLRHAGRALLTSVAGFGAATIVFGLSRNVWLSFAMLAVSGALDNVSVVIRGTLMQLLTPDEMRGRVAAVNAVFISSSNELGAFESGLTAYWFGPVVSVVGGGVGTILVVVSAMIAWPSLRRLGPLYKVERILVNPAPPAAN